MTPLTWRSHRAAWIAAGLILAMTAAGAGLPGPPGAVALPPEVPDKSAVSLETARGQARLLHETVHVTLQVVHRDYYRTDEGLIIPARSLEAVFDQLARDGHVQMRWLAVNTPAMNVDHRARGGFEQDAVKALGSGKDAYELAEPGVYRFAGAITLHSQCLKCHLPNRTSTEPRTAGLVITIPTAQK